MDWLAAITRQAGQIILTFYAGETKVSWKGVSDPVTEADQASDNFLVQAIREAFPDDGLLSEESIDDNSRFSHSLVWMIDPMDGTKEFIKRNGEFSVMVGLVQDGQPILGAVYQPTEAKLYLGGRDVGAWLRTGDTNTPLHVSERQDISRFRLVVSRSHREPLIDTLCDKLGIRDLRQSGSVGLKCGLIANGECDLYIHPSPHSKLWDSCAPQAILQAAGGTMTDIYGNALDYRKEDPRNLNGLLASNGTRHAEIAALIRETLQKD